jgi:glycosyltransferase involved in cell wall biosynthesis
MKILIPINAFGKSGGYRVLSELGSHWTAAGHDVQFLADHRSSDPYFPTRAGILWYDADGEVRAERRGAQGFAATGNGMGMYRGMHRALRRVARQYDVVLANHSLTAFPVWAAVRERSRRFYYVQAWEPEYYALERTAKARLLYALSRLSYYLPLTQIANAPIYVGHKDIRATDWIPPGLDAGLYRRRSAPPHFDGRPMVLGVIGRREPSKGTAYVLQAFEQLAAQDPHIRLSVAFGNLPQDWSHERAHVVVPRNDQELADFYRSVDILIAPGTVQLGACHYPVLESMSCGTPVITTGYLPADAESAWIVPVADAGAIADAVQAIRKTPAPELMQRLDLAHERTLPFHWDRVASRMAALFER